MTGPEHYREAERLLRLLTKPVEHGGTVIDASMNPNVAAAAQVHAILAHAAATALGTWTGTGMPQPDRMDWWRAASGEPAERKRIKEAEAAEAAEMDAGAQS